VKIEVWKDIPKFEGFYMVSDLGRVKSVERTVSYSDGRSRIFPERVLRPRPDRHGYLIVSLHKNGRWKGTIHTLVLNAFVGPPKDNEIGRHFPDRDPSNNALTNLGWGTKQQNQIDREFHRTGNHGARNAQSKLSEGDVSNIREMSGTLSKIAQIFGVTEGTISLIRRRKTWK
jgi:hypothetical protein